MWKTDVLCLTEFLVMLCTAYSSFCLADQSRDCELSSDKEEQLLTLSFANFDQDMQGGWRHYYSRGCYMRAATLLASYANKHPARTYKYPILLLHAGQLFAMSGEYEAALMFLNQHLPQAGPNDPMINAKAFTKAHIAFLEGDRPGLERALESMEAQTPFPHSEEWPSWLRGRKANLDVVQGFLACFDKPFVVAYQQSCRDLAKSSSQQ